MANISKNWIFIIIFNTLTIIEYILMSPNIFLYTLSIQIGLISMAICVDKINIIFIFTAIFLLGLGLFVNIAIYKNLFAHMSIHKVWSIYKWCIFLSGIAFLFMVIFGLIGLFFQNPFLSVKLLDILWIFSYMILFMLFSLFISTSYLSLNLTKDNSKYFWNIFSFLIMIIISNSLFLTICKTFEMLKRKFDI